MSRDSQTKMFKKDRTDKKFKKQEEYKKKKNEDSSDDNNSFYTDDDDDEEFDLPEFRKYLKKIFPSKYLNTKIKASERLKKIKQENEEEDEEQSIKKSKQSNKQPKLKQEYESEEENEQELINKKYKKQKKLKDKKSNEYDSEYSEYSDDENSSKSNKFNIIFTIGGKDEEDSMYDEDEDWETCSDASDTENEDEPISSDSSEETETEDEEIYNKKNKNKKICNKKVKEQREELDKENEDTNDSVINKLKEIHSKFPNDKLFEKCIETYKTDIKKQTDKKEKKIKKEKDRNSRIFKKILRDKNTMNDYEFYDKLEIEQQKKIIKELREINKITRVEKPYRLTLLESDIPVTFKASAMKKISSLRYMEPGSGEYYKIKNWVDTFMRIPFGKYESLPLSIDDGVNKCHEFMENAQKTLNEAVYGLNDAKMQIMQMLGQLITNPKAIGSAIAIHGPPGTGKTSLVKEGISKILNRPFAFIALGGATDSSFLEGHGYTYEGSTWGKIVQILIESKCMNPVIYFDELDKISDTPKGEEIAGILTHLTDTSQNTQFHDKYFSEIDFDLSKCLFIFSYNDESKVNTILKDRMYSIQTKGYDQKQKTVIANNYLLPKIREQVKFIFEDIIIPEQTIHYIIEHHCNKEDGVRNLKRCLEIVYTKLNLYRLMRPGSNLFEQDMSLKVEFPFTVTRDIIDKLVKKSDNGLNPSLFMLYC